MTHRSVMPAYAAAILRSACEAATAAIAERGRLDDQEIRSFIGGVADCFDADPSDVLLALGLDDLDETRNRPRLNNCRLEPDEPVLPGESASCPAMSRRPRGW